MNIVSVFEREGIELSRYGSRLKCHCPIHAEDTASCVLYPDQDRWHCFGCGKGGDVIEFVRLYKGLSFKEAKRYLGMHDGNTPEAILARQKAQKRAEFRQWCKSAETYYFTLCTSIYHVMNHATSIGYIEGYGYTDLVRNLSKYDHYLDILMGKNEKAKLNLYRQQRSGNVSR